MPATTCKVTKTCPTNIVSLFRYLLSNHEQPSVDALYERIFGTFVGNDVTVVRSGIDVDVGDHFKCLEF